ncbi:MAG: hypothetical protein REI94_10885 [Moraxellaceae bacterium]|nr:hypothetical protein [Moraxellaceae bacterium]
MLAAIGFYLLFNDPTSPVHVFVAILFLALGVNMIHASWLGRASWVARIVPLP